MAKFGDSYCWMIKDDPSVCPYIRPGEEYLINDVNKRIREKCIECEELKNDLKNLGEEKGPLFGTFSTVLDEFRKREQKLEKYGKSLKVKEEMFDTMAHLSTSLKLVLDLDEILYKVLVAFTAGSSFGFNRAIMLLSQKGKLRGYFAVGPKSPEEAYTIWNDISQKNLTIVDLLIFSPQLFQKEKEKFKEVLKKMEFDLDEGIFKRAFKTGMIPRVTSEEVLPDVIRGFYQGTPFWIVPLFSHLKRPLGVILLDNFLTKREVSQEEIKAIEIFSTEISLALERALTYEELEEAIKLEKTHKDFINFVKTKYTSEKTPIDINKVVELLYQEKKNKEKSQGVNFHLNLGSNLPLVLGNDYQLYNCIENIVSNSIEAMPEGGELFIETAEEDGFVSVGIKDTGPGISDEVMKNLFKPFFTTKTIGSGLGLYTAKGIIENLGGHIVVSCERDQGCNVTVKIPILSKEVIDEQNLILIFFFVLVGFFVSSKKVPPSGFAEFCLKKKGPQKNFL